MKTQELGPWDEDGQVWRRLGVRYPDSIGTHSADQVLYVVRWSKTPRRAAQSGLDILNECGAPTIGVVLSQVNVQKQAAYGYGDSSDYFQYFRNYYIANA